MITLTLNEEHIRDLEAALETGQDTMVKLRAEIVRVREQIDTIRRRYESLRQHHDPAWKYKQEQRRAEELAVDRRTVREHVSGNSSNPLARWHVERPRWFR